MGVTKLSGRARELLDLQVAFYVNEFTSINLEPFLKNQVNQSLIRAKCIKLDDIASRENVVSVIERYTSDLELDEGTPAVISEFAKAVYNHAILDEYRLEHLQTDKDFEQLMEDIAAHEALRERLIAELVSNPLYASLMSDLLYHGIQDYITENPLAKKIPGAQSMMKFGKSMMDLASPKLEATIKKYVEGNIRGTLKQSERFLKKNLTNEKIVELGMNAWQENKQLKLSAFKEYVAEDEFEQLYDSGYNYWYTFRKTNFFKALVKETTGFIFDQYGDVTLFELLEQASISEQALLDDLMRFAPGALNNLHEKGILDEIMRQFLLPFYESPEAKKLLAD